MKEEYGYLFALAAQEPQQEEESLYQNFSAPILSGVSACVCVKDLLYVLLKMFYATHLYCIQTR